MTPAFVTTAALTLHGIGGRGDPAVPVWLAAYAAGAAVAVSFLAAVASFRRRSLRAAQDPLLAAMVAFTAGGIALVTSS